MTMPKTLSNAQLFSTSIISLQTNTRARLWIQDIDCYINTSLSMEALIVYINAKAEYFSIEKLKCANSWTDHRVPTKAQVLSLHSQHEGYISHFVGVEICRFVPYSQIAYHNSIHQHKGMIGPFLK